jgi:hypothetical protein
MATTDSMFYAEDSSNSYDATGVTAWSTPAGSISFKQGVLGIGVTKGVLGLIDDGTLAPPAKLPPASSYTAKAGVFGGAVTDPGVAGVSTASVGVFGQSGALQKLGSVGRDSPVALTLAKTIIELAKEGERDTARLCDSALGRIAKQGK